jgi:S-adenosylmethionine uptake transporter
VVLPYPSFLSWFASRGYLQGVFWITLVALTSNLNDILMRLIGSRLPAMEIAFFRFLLSTLSLLPVMLYYGPSSFYTKRPWIHLCRAVLLFGAITCWVTGVTMVPLVTVSTLALTTQLFVLPMAAVFLNEKVGWQRVLATLLGFIGVCIIVCAESKDQALFSSLFSFNNGTLFLLAASMMFAFSDILNKKFVSQESTLSMMFYIALGTTMFGVIPAYSVWQPPTLAELILLGLLGVGGNLILFFLLRAFAATDVSALSPFRYSELFIAGITGFFIFQEVPSLWNLVGAAIIVPSTFALVRYETRQSRQHQQQGQRYAHSNLLEELT